MSVDFTLTPADEPKKDEKVKTTLVREKPNRRRRTSRETPTKSGLDNGLMSREALGSWLWGAADILRGAVSADDYGDFVLPLLFYKRLSDNYSFEYGQRLEKYKDEKVARDDMFYRVVVPDGCLWEDVRKTATNVGSKLNDVLNSIAKANPRLDRVINRTDFNNPNAIPEERLVRLIEHLNQKNLGNGKVSPDVLGDGYEYLLKKFNEVAPTRAGEFYTPREVVKVLVGCLKPEEGMEVYDPCCGSGGMLIESYYCLKEQGMDPKKLFLYGQEINDDTWAIAKMNEFLHDMEAEIVQGDTFVNPKFLDENGLKRFDLVIANPMWNQKGFKQYQEDDQYGRFQYGVSNNSSADWGWIQHMLASLKAKGRMGVVLDQGALFRGGAEGRIRKGALEDDLIECVVALPEKLFYNTGAPGCLIFLNKDKREERKDKILFIYAAERYEKIGAMNVLGDEDIENIIDTFMDFADVEKYSRVVGLNEVEENDWNLSVNRYVDIFDPPEPVDIVNVWDQLKELENQRQEPSEKLTTYLRALGNENKTVQEIIGWDIKQIQDISEVIGGSTPSTNEPKYWGGNIPFVTPTDITSLKNSNYIEKTRRYITKKGLKAISSSLLEPGTILLTSRATLGEVAINKVPLVTNQGFANIKPFSEINKLWLLHYLRSQKRELDRLSSGSTFKEVSKTSIKRMKIPVPPLVEQSGIVEVLGTVDECIRLTHEREKTLTLIKQGLIQLLFSGQIRVELREDGLHRIRDS